MSAHALAKTDAYPVRDSIAILSDEVLPAPLVTTVVTKVSGQQRVVTIRCADYAARSLLPAAISVEGQVLGITGWDSDRCVAFYKSDITIAYRSRP